MFATNRDENTRVVIELKRDGNPKVVINNLYKHTALNRPSASTCWRSIDGRPKLLSLKDAIVLLHRAPARGRPAPHTLPSPDRRKSRRRSSKASSSRWRTSMTSSRSSAIHGTATMPKPSCWRSPGRAKPSSRSASSIRDEARLVDGQYRFTEKQVGHILDLRLYQLTGLERESIKKEYDDPDRNDQRPARHPRQRSTRAEDHQDGAPGDPEQVWQPSGAHRSCPRKARSAIEDLIANEGVIITITHNGFIKRTAG